LRETNHPLPSQLHFWILGSVVAVPPALRSVFTQQRLPGVCLYLDLLPPQFQFSPRLIVETLSPANQRMTPLKATKGQKSKTPHA
jgi:hypothetical protein